MESDKLQEKSEMISNIYEMRQETLARVTKELQEKLKVISVEEVQEALEKVIKDSEKRKEIKDKLNELIENYEIKMAYFIEEGYKQGFKDAFNLIMECRK